MSMSLIAQGIGSMENANLYAQTTAAEEGISLALPFLGLEQAWMSTINQDALNYATATDASTGNPSMAAQAAEDNEQMSIDQTASDLETGNFQKQLETLKSIVSYLGINLKSVFNLEIPINQYMKMTLSQIMRI